MNTNAQQTCRLCKWWGPNRDPLREIEDDIRDEIDGDLPKSQSGGCHWGCENPIFIDGINDLGSALAPNALSAAGADPDVFLSLLTGPEFGCVHWEQNY